jgi:integrase
VTVSNEITRIRVVFKFAFDAALIDRPTRYGPAFKRPSKRTLRLAKLARGVRMLEAAELRNLLAAARQPIRAMMLLAINAGLGNGDLGQLEVRHVDLKSGWLSYPRPKTGIDRRAKLWPETVTAVEEAIAQWPEPMDPADGELVFLIRGCKSVVGRTGHKIRSTYWIESMTIGTSSASRRLPEPAISSGRQAGLSFTGRERRRVTCVQRRRLSSQRGRAPESTDRS